METRKVNRRLPIAGCVIACVGAFASGCGGEADALLRNAASRLDTDSSRIVAADKASKAAVRCAEPDGSSSHEGASPIDELRRLERLHRGGVLTRDEHQLLRQRVLDCI